MGLQVRRHFMREAQAALAILNSAADDDSRATSPANRSTSSSTVQESTPAAPSGEVRGKPPKRRAARGKAGPAAPRALTKQSVEYVEHAAAWVARYGADFHTVLQDKHQGTVGWEFLSAPQASAVGRYYRAMVQASAPPPLLCAFSLAFRTA